jgi:hypothetical protein
MLPSAPCRRDVESVGGGALAVIRWCLTWAACLLAGCAASKVDLSDDCRLAADQGAVVGRLRITSGGASVSLSSIFGESKGGLFLLPERDGGGCYVPLYGDGVFLWSLRRGTYRIASFEYRTGSLQRSGRVMARFEVEPGIANLIGTLAVDVAGTRFVTTIDPDDERPLKGFQRRCRGVGMESRKRPMRREEVR